MQKLADLPSLANIQEQSLKGIKTSRNETSSAVLKMGASADLGITISQNFISSDTVTINATIVPRVQESGKIWTVGSMERPNR